MKKIIIILILAVMFSGCAQEERLDYAETIEECNSLCYSEDSEAYCNKTRTISINGVEVTGTCRAFSKTNNVEGFIRCKGFCTEYGRDVYCEVDGKYNPGCDGIV